jgi:hypothetical protein
MTRFGERIGQAAAASFPCARCGGMAGVVKVERAGTTIDTGLPLGQKTCDRDAIVVDFYGTASRFADAATLDAVQEIVSSHAPDPAALRRIDRELAPFYCPDCDPNYCGAGWRGFPVFDEGFNLNILMSRESESGAYLAPPGPESSDVAFRGRVIQYTYFPVYSRGRPCQTAGKPIPACSCPVNSPGLRCVR